MAKFEPGLSKARYADRILKHYIAGALEKAGVLVDRDVKSELTGLVYEALKQLSDEVEIYVDQRIEEALKEKK